MSPMFKTLVNVSIWIMFLKGLLAVMITIYTIGQAYWCGQTTPMVGVISCAAGTFAFAMTCVAVWIRGKID